MSQHVADNIALGAIESEGWNHQYAVVNEVRLHYVECGSGQLVVLLHGFPEFWYAWRHQIPALAGAGYRVIALDLRGYNWSEKPKGVRHYRLEALLGDVLGIIHHAGEQRAVVVGHDWGGAIAWNFAMRHPQAVEKLIVLNAPHPQRFLEELPTFSQLCKSWYMFIFQLPWLPEILIRSGNFSGLAHTLRNDPIHPGAFSEIDIAHYQQAIAQPGALTATINYYRALFRINPWKYGHSIIRIDIPTLLIWGEQDRYLGIRLTEGLEPLVPKLQLERIPDASHWVQAEVPERVNELMVDFLRTADGVSPVTNSKTQ
ncbi:MAG: alpha/beta fold hydrolase [Candidatus Methylumidiphilus sp.]